MIIKSPADWESDRAVARGSAILGPPNFELFITAVGVQMHLGVPESSGRPNFSQLVAAEAKRSPSSDTAGGPALP